MTTATETATHTPGPWIIGNGLQVWKDGYNTCASPRICTIQGSPEPVEQIDHETMQANARLIAAAPELLHALTRLREWVRQPWAADDSPENEQVILDADRAIAAATAA